VRRFNELLPELDRAGVDVIGASVDTAEENAAFREAEGLGYELVSDPTRELVEELGLGIDIEEYGRRSARCTYLLEPDGTILRIWQVGRGDAILDHPGEVLDAVRELAPA
jgi:peroxiredoxin Q/BCP